MDPFLKKLSFLFVFHNFYTIWNSSKILRRETLSNTCFTFPFYVWLPFENIVYKPPCGCRSYIYICVCTFVCICVFMCVCVRMSRYSCVWLLSENITCFLNLSLKSIFLCVYRLILLIGVGSGSLLTLNFGVSL